MSLAEIREPPPNDVLLLIGKPGAGKTTFCQQMMIELIASERPIIFVSTEQNIPDVVSHLKTQGIGSGRPEFVRFVDAYTKTVGLTSETRVDTVYAHCADLNSLSIGITKQRKDIREDGLIIIIDSLTSPYLFNGLEVVKFLRMFLSKLAGEGNSVIITLDEGCGKPEDLGAIQSIVNGIIHLDIENNKQTIQVIKHPCIQPSILEQSIKPVSSVKADLTTFDEEMMRRWCKYFFPVEKGAFRAEIGDLISPIWPNLAHWSGMLWDPSAFPVMIYDLNREEGSIDLWELNEFYPIYMRAFIHLVRASMKVGIIPKDLTEPKSIRRLFPLLNMGVNFDRCGQLEYVPHSSFSDHHTFRVYNNSDCVGLENVGTTIASHLPPLISGQLAMYERRRRIWHGVETKCLGLGDPYCEFVATPDEPDNLQGCLVKSTHDVERIVDRLIELVTGALVEEPTLSKGNPWADEMHIHAAFHAMGYPHVAGPRFCMAMRMGGARTGRLVGRRLQERGVTGALAARQMLEFIQACNVGLTSSGETLRIRDNVESMRTRLFMRSDEPSCYFTTGFLNGFYSVVMGQRVREVKCLAADDPFCEWVFE